MSALKQFDPGTVQAREGLVLGDLALYSIAEVESLEKAAAEARDARQRMRDALLDQTWHERCDLIPDYMPPFPSSDTRPEFHIRFNDGTEYPPFLRYSKGPKQGFFWDIYGEDFINEELAIIALSKAPYPRNVGPIVFTFTLPAIDAARKEAR